jgi:diacylglycerol kinase (ATP)
MARRSLFIVNPAAGAGRAGDLWAQVRRELSSRDLSPEAILTTRAGEATAIARAAASKCDRVIAVGGDGTVSEVAEGLLGVTEGQCALGIVPLGTGNDFAQTISILGLPDAFEALAADHRRMIDVIEVHCVANNKLLHRHALVFAGAGIIGPTLRHTTPLAKKLLGRAGAYRAGLLRALWHYQPADMRVTCDEVASQGDYLFLGASNGAEAGGGMRLAPGARIDDGLLNVNLVGNLSRWESLKQLRRLSRGQHTAHPQVRYFTARNVTLESDPASEVAADGEIIGHTPARFAVKPRALPVLMPV